MNVKVNESGCYSLSGVVVFSGASLVLVEVEFPGTVCSVEGDVFRLDGGFCNGCGRFQNGGISCEDTRWSMNVRAFFLWSLTVILVLVSVYNANVSELVS